MKSLKSDCDDFTMTYSSLSVRDVLHKGFAE